MLPKNSCVLPGWKIFEIMFLGTKFKGTNVVTNQEQTFTMKDDFYEVFEPLFENILADVVSMCNNNAKRTFVEQWYEVLKNVMKHYQNDSEKSDGIEQQNINYPLTTKAAVSSDAANDFYIYINDE